MANKYDTNAELEQLYALYRTVCLNVRYWGRRAHWIGMIDEWLEIVAAVSSSLVLAVVVLNFGIDHWIKVTLAVIAAVSAAILRLLGLGGKAKTFEKLHFVYGELCSQIELLIADVRRCGAMLDKHVAAAAIMHQFYAHLAPLDEPNPNRKLIDELVIEVKKAIPPDSLWMPDDYWTDVTSPF